MGMKKRHSEYALALSRHICEVLDYQIDDYNDNGERQITTHRIRSTLNAVPGFVTLPESVRILVINMVRFGLEKDYGFRTFDLRIVS